MLTDIQARIIAAIAAVIAGWAAQHLGIDQQTANVVSTAIVSGGIGWATKFYTDWNKKTVPQDAVVVPANAIIIPAKVLLPPEPPAPRVG